MTIPPYATPVESTPLINSYFGAREPGVQPERGQQWYRICSSDLLLDEGVLMREEYLLPDGMHTQSRYGPMPLFPDPVAPPGVSAV